MAVGLDRFWPFSVSPPALRLARLEAALDLPWSPSSVISIRARARAYWGSGVLKCRVDPVAAQGLLQQGFILSQEINDQAGAARCMLTHGAAKPAFRQADQNDGRNGRGKKPGIGDDHKGGGTR